MDFDHIPPTCTARIVPDYFDLIVKGEKTVEGRLNKPPFSLLKKGDILRLIDSNDPHRWMDVRVGGVRIYPSFHDMLAIEGLQICLPSISSIEEGCALYHSFPGYKQEEGALGVIAIHISPIHTITS